MPSQHNGDYVEFCSVTMRRSITLRLRGVGEGSGSASEEGQSTTQHCVYCVLLMEEQLKEMEDSG